MGTTVNGPPKLANSNQPAAVAVVHPYDHVGRDGADYADGDGKNASLCVVFIRFALARIVLPVSFVMLLLHARDWNVVFGNDYF
jgi:hypothetical protein